MKKGYFMEFLRNKCNKLLVASLLCLFYFFGDARASFSINMYPEIEKQNLNEQAIIEEMKNVFSDLQKRNLKLAAVQIKKVLESLQELNKHLFEDDRLFVNNLIVFFRLLLSKVQSFFSPMSFKDYQKIESRLEALFKDTEEFDLSSEIKGFKTYLRHLLDHELPALKKGVWKQSIISQLKSFLKIKKIKSARKEALKNAVFYDLDGNQIQESNEEKLLSEIEKDGYSNFDSYEFWKSFDTICNNVYIEKPVLDKEYEDFFGWISYGEHFINEAYYPQLSIIFNFCKEVVSKIKDGHSLISEFLFDDTLKRLSELKKTAKKNIDYYYYNSRNTNLLPLECKNYNMIVFWEVYINIIKSFFVDSSKPIKLLKPQSEPTELFKIIEEPEQWNFEEED